MQITNGSVSRTYKPADYEGRTVTFSFTLDPADNVDAETAKIAYLTEKHARHMPNPADQIGDHGAQPAPKTRAPRAVPPLTPPTTVADALIPPTQGSTSDPFGAAGATASSAPASVSGSENASNSLLPTPVAEITDATLQGAIKAKVAADAKHTPGVLALVREFTGNPLASIYTVTDQAKRVEFLARLVAL